MIFIFSNPINDVRPWNFCLQNKCLGHNGTKVGAIGDICKQKSDFGNVLGLGEKTFRGGGGSELCYEGHRILH